MKNFRKNKEGLFICEECGETFTYKQFLGRHVNKYHGSSKIYYDKWLKEDDEGKCKICEEETLFTGFKNGYKNCCCKEHTYKYHQICTEKSNLRKYGVRCISQVENFKLKARKIKKEKYGHEFYRNMEKLKITNLRKYGVENYAQTEEFKIRCKETCLKRYGVEHTHQNPEILEKAFKSAKIIKQYKDTVLYYQGSYELDFLEKYYEKFLNIKRGLPIKYIYERKNKVYHPDFYIPELNLIIEIKSSWTLKIDIEINEKRKATIANGFNYLMILDKDYTSFNEMICTITSNLGVRLA